ncbi:GTP 3',8-cyclase MoaA [Halarcobacter anaerophilus]|uniref:GTP 3',8-cyclase n=1 Tax=Halarcobacter anaerophilus TaxID=877500 RepID=A0A4Q0XVE3_9BACT|nr:GTP 3',8-cyclase MoaA [Halarcobacter anaerophilus]QDF28033.1 molybdenum cofactor biosynthesis protein A [Halarcobacter anaerophilus]RXJ61466.1 GTP 3',8-cyclase MoaA [Halarcobacter anaerophilus]
MLIDGHGRKVDYLRVSVTERCNFRCQYCMPEKPFSWVPREELLTYEELFEFIKVAIDKGINKVRVTGGEPLLREGLENFIRMISEYKEGLDLALTTNGYLLPKVAQKLADAGLKRINISLDSLKEEVAAKIAQKNVLKTVLKGIEAARVAGLKIKINCVPLKGINESEIIDLLEFCKERGYEIRFIEYMENDYASKYAKGLDSVEIQNIIKEKYTFKKLERCGTSPSQEYELEDGYKFGIIEPHKDDFCSTCNRIRLTASGVLIPCLYYEDAQSIKEAIKAKDIKKAVEILKDVLKNKPEKNRWTENSEISARAFYETGG